MKSILKKYLAVLLSILILVQLVTAIRIDKGWSGIFSSSFILYLLIVIAKPFINIIVFPLSILTFNLIHWIINIIIFYIWIIIAKEITVTDWNFSGLNNHFITLSAFNFSRWQVIILSGLLFSIIYRFFNWLLK
ncbi:hypothetical protein A2Y99_02685 [Candidatus Gottesmanbacteria bacterium RBG_13_37_7]|uniref:Uncharacterized protein n=1 Tax=Candidatus Gottesmanbacteria bacterium RBG_13_37_7 TaxID=1798369 RepID=A0A1F5YJF7_9BACT|nr:MAG: hypothetical protein A2Y99_02685 [Candidatus Gottesmanbacteria bacterium RBG_13_37_7]